MYGKKKKKRKWQLWDYKKHNERYKNENIDPTKTQDIRIKLLQYFKETLQNVIDKSRLNENIVLTWVLW